MTFAERFRVLRGQLGQVEFAKKIGSSQTGVSAYEKGQRKPDYDTLIRVSEACNVTLDWLLLGTGPMYRHAEEENMADCRPFEKTESTQPIDAVDKKNIEDRQNSRQSAIFEYMEKTIALQERIASLVEDKATLQVALERARMDTERRDQRIRELERENAQLREAQKGATRLYCSHTGDAG